MWAKKKVKAANDEVIVFIGKATEYLYIGGGTEVFYIYISPDINGLIVGLDWLRRQGRIEWDFTNNRIQLGNGGWLKLHDDAKSRCRRIYAEVEVELPTRQETIVPVRVSHWNRRDLPFVSVTESLKIPQCIVDQVSCRPDSPTCRYVSPIQPTDSKYWRRALASATLNRLTSSALPRLNQYCQQRRRQ